MIEWLPSRPKQEVDITINLQLRLRFRTERDVPSFTEE